jgi:hypothetical protein
MRRYLMLDADPRFDQREVRDGLGGVPEVATGVGVELLGASVVRCRPAGACAE